MNSTPLVLPAPLPLVGPVRPARLVLTFGRWGMVTALAGLVAVLPRSAPGQLASHIAVLPVLFHVFVSVGLVGLMVFWLLRAEESRVSRELRIARTGTTVLRQFSLRRRAAPFWARRLAPTLGTTALLLAEGEATAARLRFDANPRIFAFGRVTQLADVVQADLDRARGGAEALEDAIARLARTMPIAHAEAERYRVHVLVKAILEQGDAGVARDLADDLRQSPDDALRVYVVWLREWFNLDHLAPPSEADVCLALLLARTHGADELVTKLMRPAPPSLAEPVIP